MEKYPALENCYTHAVNLQLSRRGKQNIVGKPMG